MSGSTRAPIGRRTWLVAGGSIPLASHGDEPAFTSREQLAILNLSDTPAQIELTIFFEDRPPLGGYALAVSARRVAKVRFNDLIDPRPLPLETPYAYLLRASVRVVVQHGGLDSSSRRAGRMCTMAYPVA